MTTRRQRIEALQAAGKSKREIETIMSGPLIDQPRPWSAIGDQPGADARWRDIPDDVRTINRMRALDIQQRAR
jgi:hypothetical protein